MKNFKEFKKLNEQTHEESRKRQLDTIKRANIYTFLKGAGFETGTDYVQNDSKNRFIVKDKETAESMIDELALFDLFDIMVSGPDPLDQSDVNEIKKLRIFDWSNPVTIQVKRIGDVMEAELKGNLGLPGEDGEGENFLGNIKRQKDAIYGRINPMQVGRELMSIQSYLSRKTKGKEKELEKLALDLIKHLYGEVLGDVEMDIKLVDSGEEVKDFLDDMTKKSNKPKKDEEEEEEQDEDQEEQETPETPEDIKRKIKLETDKRKIANLIIQGEALNVKTVIEMPECVDRIKRIFGEQEGEVYIQNLIRITELGKALDWFIPSEHRAMSMEQHPEGFAGACHIDWDGDDEEDSADGESGEPEDFTPVLRVVGVDFVMLIHESVKAVYEYLSTPGISKDPEIAQIVKSQTSSFADEADEFKYGSEVAAELRDFVNINPKVDKYPNTREYIYMALMKMDAEDFLFLMKGILSSTPSARKKIDSMIDEFIASMEQYERDLAEWEESQKQSSEEESDIDKMIRLASTGGEEEESDEVDYSKMSNSQLNDLIDDALDREDYKEVEKLSKFLKESVYDRIIENYIDKKIKK